jgi:hypothetical protein
MISMKFEGLITKGNGMAVIYIDNGHGSPVVAGMK